MKIVLPNGRVLHRPMHIANSTGYVAKKIVLRNDDISALGRMAQHSPIELTVFILQLAARLRDNRAPLLTRKV